MPALVNIARTADKPLFIDTSDITAVLHVAQDDTLIVYNSKGRLLHIRAEQWNIDPAEALQKISAGGAPFIPFPQGEGAAFHIAPAAVTFATLSKPDADGRQGAIVGVKGYGRAETTQATPADTEALLSAVRAVKPLLAFRPEQASSRWVTPGGLFIDPLSVTRISDAGNDKIFVKFAQSGQLDIHLTPYSVGTFMDPHRKPGLSSSEFNADFSQAMRKRDSLREEMDAARAAFINDLAAQNGKLVSASSSRETNYVDVGDFDFMHYYERDGDYYLLLSPQNEQADPIQLYFPTEQERQAAFESLHRAKTGLPAPAAEAAPQKKPAGKNFSL